MRVFLSKRRQLILDLCPRCLVPGVAHKIGGPLQPIAEQCKLFQWCRWCGRRLLLHRQRAWGEHVVPKVARDGDDPRPVEAMPLAISRRTTATKADPSADWQNKLYTLLQGLWTGTTSLRMIILAEVVEAAARIFYKYGTAEKQSGHGWW